MNHTYRPQFEKGEQIGVHNSFCRVEAVADPGGLGGLTPHSEFFFFFFACQ